MAEKILFKTGLDAIESTDIEGVGTLRKDTQGRVYKWVKNLGAASTTNDLVAGQPVVYSDAVGADTRHLGVIDTLSGGDEEMLAGVAMAALTAQYYGWIQIKGISITASVTHSSTATQVLTIGDVLKVVSTSESFEFGAAGGNVPVNAPAIAWESYASHTAQTSAAATVMLNCAV